MQRLNWPGSMCEGRFPKEPKADIASDNYHHKERHDETLYNTVNEIG